MSFYKVINCVLFQALLPVFQITGGENVGDRRHVRIHYHEAKKHAARELVTAHAHSDEHAVDVHSDGVQSDFRGETNVFITR